MDDWMIDKTGTIGLQAQTLLLDGLGQMLVCLIGRRVPMVSLEKCPPYIYHM